MKRFIYSKLVEWKNLTGRRVLTINGVKGVGKTSLILEFGKKEFSSCHHFRVCNNEELKESFYACESAKEFLTCLNRFSGKEVNVHEDLVFFDSLAGDRDFLAQAARMCEIIPEMKCICVDMYLKAGIHKRDIRVNKVNFLSLKPLSFEEFLYTADTDTYNCLKNVRIHNGFPKELHTVLMKYLKHYFIVGGMPEAVLSYMENPGDFESIREIQRHQLEVLYDSLNSILGKSQGKNLIKIISLIFKQLSRENKKFKFSDISSSRRFSALKHYFDTLKDLDITHSVSLIEACELPLIKNCDDKKFKLGFFDTGLLGCVAGIHPSVILRDISLSDTIVSAFAENFIIQELNFSGAAEIFSWYRNMAKIEFLLEKKGSLFPLEVKDDSSGKLKSLKVFKESCASETLSRFSLHNYSVKDSVSTFPLYLISLFYRGRILSF